MSEEQQLLNQLEYYKTAGENLLKIYTLFEQLSRLDYSNNQNLVYAVNLLRSQHPDSLKGIENPSQFKKMIQEKVQQYSGLVQTYEEHYNELYEKIYFPLPVHNVYFGKYILQPINSKKSKKIQKNNKNLKNNKKNQIIK